MKVYFDTEFLEDGKIIDLISIGMIGEDGREYYAVNYDADWKRIVLHKWLRENVLPSIPGRIVRMSYGANFYIDDKDSSVKPQWVIANEVRNFLQSYKDLELWAWYGAYDHVVLSQLWGPMINHPEGIPMYTHDLKQEVDRIGSVMLPKFAVTEHNALEDAREVKLRHEWLVSEGDIQFEND